MRWCFEKIIRELKKSNYYDIWPKPKEWELKQIRLFASKYFKDIWKQTLSHFDYDLEQLREFADYIDWEKWYHWKGRNCKLWILWEFKDKCPKMQEDWEKAEKRYGVQYIRDMKKK